MTDGKKLGLPLAIALVAGNMIGSGIYLLPASLATIGSSSLIGWGVALAGALVLGVAFSRLALIMQPDEGLLDRIYDRFGLLAGFTASGLYWLYAVVGNVAVGLAVTGYLGALFPVLAGTQVATTATTIAVFAVLLGVNLIGPRMVGRVELAALLLGLVPVVAVALFGWAWFDPARFAAAWNPAHADTATALPSTVMTVFWAFLGLESAVVVAPIIANPRRNLPLATLGGITIAGLLYIAACSAIFGIVAPDALAKSNAPFALVTEAMFGALTGTAVAACAALKASGTVAGWMLVGARSLPHVERGRTVEPRQALWIGAGISVIILFATASPTLAEQFTFIANVSVGIALVIYTALCADLFMSDRSFGARLAATGGAGFSVWVLLLSGRDLQLWTLGLVVAAAAIYLVARRLPLRRQPAI